MLTSPIPINTQGELNLFQWTTTLTPQDNPYDGGLFNLKINFPVDYPSSPPKIF